MRGIIIALLLGASAPALAAPADDLKAVIDDHWAWYLSVNPIQATSLGVRDYDDRIGDISLAAADRQVEQFGRGNCSGLQGSDLVAQVRKTQVRHDRPFLP